MLPNLLLVGAMKCGTTSLARQLETHPDIFMSPSKEPRFFCTDEHWQRGVGWYERFFEQAGSHKYIGEASTTYTKHPTHPLVPARMAQVLDMSRVRLLYLVRHPIDRLISHYTHEWYHGSIDEPVDRAIDVYPEFVQYGKYYDQIQQYREYAAPEQWTVIPFEQFVENPAAVHRSLYGELGVDTQFVPPDLSPQNVSSSKIRRSGFAEALRSVPGLKHAARLLLPAAIRGQVTRVGGRRTSKPALSAATRRRLAGMFRPDAEALSEFTGRDFVALWNLG